MKPEERLTIEGVLAHPWLNCTEALDNVLPSAQMMMDKVNELPHTLNNYGNLCIHITYHLFSGGSCQYPAGPRRAVGQHENSGSEYQPEASKLCQQPNPQETKTAGV